MAFQTSTLPTTLRNKPRNQAEGLMRLSTKAGYMLGELDIFASTRLSRSGGTKKDFTSTGAAVDGEWWAVKIAAIEDGTVQTVQMPLGITGTPAGTAVAMIYSDSGGLPNSQNGGDSGSVTIATGVSTTAGLITFTWASNYPTILKGTTYWVVIKTAGYTYTDTTTELWLDTDTNGSSEVAKYDSNGVPTWTTAGATVGSDVVITCSTFTARDTIIDSKDDFTKYALFATPFCPSGENPITLTITGTSGQSGRSNRATGTAYDFTSTGADEDAEWYGIKFTANRTGNVVTAKVPLKKVGSPVGTMAAMVYSTSGGLPNVQNNGDSGNVNISSVSTTAGYITFTWSSNYPTLVAGTDYWLVVKTAGYTYNNGVTELSLTGDASNGSSEVAKYDNNGSPTWTTAGATVGANVKVGGIVLSGSVTLTGNCTYDVAELVELTSEDSGWGSVSSVVVAGGNAYDTIHLWAVPDVDTTNYERIYYFRSCDVNGGAVSIPVPDGFDPMLVSVRTRRNATITIGKDMVTYNAITQYVGREVTMVLELRPGGGGGVSEYIIAANCIVSTPFNAPDNAMVTASLDGNFGALLIFEP